MRAAHCGMKSGKRANLASLIGPELSKRANCLSPPSERHRMDSSREGRQSGGGAHLFASKWSPWISLFLLIGASLDSLQVARPVGASSLASAVSSAGHSSASAASAISADFISRVPGFSGRFGRPSAPAGHAPQVSAASALAQQGMALGSGASAAAGSLAGRASSVALAGWPARQMGVPAARQPSELESLQTKLSLLEAKPSESLEECAHWFNTNQRVNELTQRQSALIERPEEGRKRAECDKLQRITDNRARLAQFEQSLRQRAGQLDSLNQLVAEYLELRRLANTDSQLEQDVQSAAASAPELSAGLDRLDQLTRLVGSLGLQGPRDQLAELDGQLRALVDREAELDEHELGQLAELAESLERALGSGQLDFYLGRFRYLMGSLDAARAVLMHKAVVPATADIEDLPGLPEPAQFEVPAHLRPEHEHLQAPAESAPAEPEPQPAAQAISMATAQLPVPQLHQYSAQHQPHQHQPHQHDQQQPPVLSMAHASAMSGPISFGHHLTQLGQSTFAMPNQPHLPQMPHLSQQDQHQQHQHQHQQHQPLQHQPLQHQQHFGRPHLGPPAAAAMAAAAAGSSAASATATAGSIQPGKPMMSPQLVG